MHVTNMANDGKTTPDGAVNHTQLTLLLRSWVTLYYLMGCVLEMCNIKGPSVE